MRIGIKWVVDFFRRNSELLFWAGGLLWLALSDPGSSHLILCPLRLTGFEHCPGCGLGHAISYLFRGDLAGSFHSHPLGIPALFFILLRIYRISPLLQITLNKKKYHGHHFYDTSEHGS